MPALQGVEIRKCAEAHNEMLVLAAVYCILMARHVQGGYSDMLCNAFAACHSSSSADQSTHRLEWQYAMPDSIWNRYVCSRK